MASEHVAFVIRKEQDIAVKLDGLLRRFSRSSRAITVNFRELVPWVNGGERATHYLHTYPAKLLPQIAVFFLASARLVPFGGSVLDPFCGSGTVVLESMLHGRSATGVDSNPFACLIARAKTTVVCVETLVRRAAAVSRRARRLGWGRVPDVVNIDYWYYPHAIDQLSRLRRALDDEPAGPVRDLLEVCFSASARRASLADPRLSVPVRLRLDQYEPGHAFYASTRDRLRRLRRQRIFDDFDRIAGDAASRVRAMSAMVPDNVSARIVEGDSRRLHEHAVTAAGSNEFDLILTSPPYVGAQKYIRASSLSLGWNDLQGARSLRELEDLNIGREHYPQGAVLTHPVSVGIPDADRQIARIAAVNPLRAHITSNYLTEMRLAFASALRLLRPGGRMVLVAGNNRICDEEFFTQRYLTHMLKGMGMTVELALVDAIRSRGLMTRRNSTASVITREWVTVLRKRG